jgi:hypothetical protein
MSELLSPSTIVHIEKNVKGRTLVRWLARITMSCLVLFVMLVVILHFLRPETNPLVRGVSYYAVGPYGFLMTTAFLLIGIGGAALTLGLFLGSIRRHRSLIGMLLLGLWSISSALGAVFPIDATGAPPTTTGMVHELIGLNFLLFVPAVLLLSRQFAQDKRWHAFSRPIMIIAILILMAAIGLLLMNGRFQSLGLGGLMQRIYWLISLLWLFLVAVGLRSIVASPLHNDTYSGEVNAEKQT